jgi:hypothetical protein
MANKFLQVGTNKEQIKISNDTYSLDDQILRTQLKVV